MKRAYMLVGVPGSGKSTWLKQFSDHGAVLVSSDQYIEEAAATAGKTYSEVFADEADRATVKMKADITQAIEDGRDIVWDQTNLTVKSRRPKVERLKQAGYDVVAIVFELLPDELERRRSMRKFETGKTVAPHILRSMEASYQRPTEAEGFSKIALITE